MSKGKSLYISDGSKITQEDIEQALIEVGLQKGDVVLVHSDVGSFGKLGEIKNKDKFLSSLLTAFLNVLGEGTLVVPTYTYSFCKKEIFDVKNSKSTVGIFSEFVRNQASAIRSDDPIFSHAAIGKDAKKLLTGVSDDCFGDESFFDRLYKANGKIINFGKIFDITFLHYIERKFDIDYRFNKKFYGKIIRENGKNIMKNVTFYVRYVPEEGRNVEYEMSRLGNELQKRGLLKKVEIGDNFILLSKAEDCFRVGIEMLEEDDYAFLKTNPNELLFESLPFYIGLLDSPDNKGLPNSLPFTMLFDKNKGLIVQKYSSQTEEFLKKAYQKGSLISTNLGQGNFGVRRADDVLKHISSALKGNIREKSFLEVGCADGYLLRKLKDMGANKVLGCEPGPMAIEGRKNHGIEIINNFFEIGLVKEKFDCVFSYGVLEHIWNPNEFINAQKDAVNEGGIIFVAVPNCETKLRMGDASIIGHEHWNYFTRNSLTRLLQRSGLKDVESDRGMNNAMIYAWGIKNSKDQEILENDASEENIFHNFYGKLMKNRASLKRRAEVLGKQGKTLGLYGGGLNILEILPSEMQPRFFDGDIAKHGKYFPGCKNAIESPKNLLSNKVDEVWITAIDYNKEILDYLKNELKISSEIELFSIKDHIDNNNLGNDMYDLVKKLFPICRSITGNGVRKTLKIIKEYIPIKIYEIPTGTKVFDWTVPKEWNIKDAYVKNSKGKKIIDFKKSNLHILNYSIPVNKKLSLKELKEHLFTLPDYPEWIPYRTSYYQENWGFCLTHRQYQQLEEDTYEIVIDSSLKDGSLTYGELYLKGESEEEILLTCYICHPSLCNDNLSGIALITFLANHLKDKHLKYSYRFLFVPETIGAITWLSLNETKTSNIKHGLVATCVGDSDKSTYKKSREVNAVINKVVEKVLVDSGEPYEVIDFFPSGSDERQFSSPGFNLPIGSLMRTPYGRFCEYHTSADNLDFVKSGCLADSFKKYLEVIFILENNITYLNLNPKCEPQLVKRGLIGSGKGEKLTMFWVLNLSDGSNSLLDISIRSGISFEQIKNAADVLLEKNLLERITKKYGK